MNTTVLSVTSGTVTVQATGTSTTDGFTNGVWAGNVSIDTAQTNAVITATDSAGGLGTGTETGTSNAFNVGAGTLDHFTWTVGPAAGQDIEVGTNYSVTIEARDSNNNVVTGYTGAANFVNFSGTGVEGTPFSGAFTNGVWSGTVEVVNADAAGVTITATDAAGGLGSGTEAGPTNAFDAIPGTLDHFSWATQPVGPYEAGDNISVRIEAQDVYNNVIDT